MNNELGIKLIVGLGNPGLQYKKTRHNVGFWLIEALAEKYDSKFKYETKFNGSIANIMISNYECRLLMPATFMNLSGEAVRKLSSFFKIPIESILIIHDELDFPPGVVRIKKNGGANSHNGVQSIIDQLGSNNFLRLRIGIGKPSIKEDCANYVLQSPNKLETKQIEEAISYSIEIIPNLIIGNFEKATQILHSKVC